MAHCRILSRKALLTNLALVGPLSGVPKSGANTTGCATDGRNSGPEGKIAEKLSSSGCVEAPTGPEIVFLFSEIIAYDCVGGSLHCPRPFAIAIVAAGPPSPPKPPPAPHNPCASRPGPEN